MQYAGLFWQCHWQGQHVLTADAIVYKRGSQMPRLVTAVTAVEHPVGAGRCACRAESRLAGSDHSPNRSFCILMAQLRPIPGSSLLSGQSQKLSLTCKRTAGRRQLRRTAGHCGCWTGALTWLKSMVKLPSKQVNLPFLGVYFSMLSGLAPRISVDAAPQHAPEITSSNTACARPYMLAACTDCTLPPTNRS